MTMVLSARLRSSLFRRITIRSPERMRLALCAWGLLAGIPCAIAATVPGAIPGSFNVTESGAAAYSIPITVPPGTAGMEPKLSLDYSSQRGNGIAGIGWSISGLSAITRCPHTIVNDGIARGVHFDAYDRFCLDGQRLLLVNGASYGAVGAEYRTEIESFSRIVSYGGTAGDPQYFKVWTRAGQIVEYGNTADARVEAQGKTIAGAWVVNKISDTVGNYIAFAYFEDNVNGEHRIERIDYTGNAAAGISPYNAVEFQYETRPDPSSGYLAGTLSRQTQRLTHIVTRANGTLVTDYGLSYEIGTTTGRSRLVSLTQCAGNGDCLSPTMFGWREGEATAINPVSVESTASVGSVNDTWFALGNLNGDGKADALILKYLGGTSNLGLFSPFRANSNGQFDSIETTQTSLGDAVTKPTSATLILADTNADGVHEPVLCGSGLFTGYSTTWEIKHWGNYTGKIDSEYQSRGYTQTGRTPLGHADWCIGGDIDGDGTEDILYKIQGYLLRFLSRDGVPYHPGTRSLTLSLNTNPGESFLLGADIDGYEPKELVHYDPASGVLRVWFFIAYQDGSFSVLPPVSTTIDAGGSPSDRWFTVADVNGDGLGDMVLHTPADGKLKVWLSKGDGTVTGKFETTGFSTGGTPADTWFLMVDVNSDGRADAVKYTPSTGNIVFALSNGDGTFDAPVSTTIATGFNPTPTVGPNPTTAWFQPADVNGDGLPDWVIYHPGEGKIKVNLGQGAVPDLLLSITDGHGAVRGIVYKPLTDPAVYTKGSGATYPVQDVQNATYVVSETAADDGIGGQYRIAYRYEGARMHLTGRGFLGFAALEQTDLQTGIVTRTQYRQDFPYIGQPTLVTQTTSGGIELKRVENTHAAKAIPGGGQFVYLAYSKEQSKDLNGAVLPVTETWNTYGDDWGNLTRTIVQTSDGFKKQTDSVYTNDAANWLLGRLTRATVTSTANTWAQTRVSAFEYASATGLLKKEIVEPDQPQYRLDTAYTFDAFGNRVSVTVSSPATGTAAIVTRTTTTGYDPQGRFPATVTNALGHTETKVFDARFGAVTSLTGPNNLTTTWQYDGFGRKTRETRADGTYTIWTYAACDAACPAWGVYRIVTQVYAADGTQAAPASVVYFDKLNRETRTATQGFDGRWIYKDTVHDPRGNVDKLSRPYYAGDPAYWIDQTHDDLNRLVQVIEPDNLAKPALVVDYNGLTVTRTNRKDQITVETRNSQGQKIGVTDAMGQSTLYNYDPFGNLQYVLSPGGNLESMAVYDIRGRKIWNYTPDMRSWTYEYNVLSELVKQTDAKGQVTTMTYDTLGRMTQRVESGLTSTWTWDSAPYGKGKLQSAGTGDYLRTHWYDDKGRPQLTLWNLGAGNPLFINAVAYDNAGRVSEEYFLLGISFKRVYNALGYQTETRNTNSNALYWQLNQMDAEGHVTQETYGNGTVAYTTYLPANGRFNYRLANRNGNWIDYYYQGYDDLGNINSRYHMGGGGGDNLTYDALNRLTQVQHFGSTAWVDAITYDTQGNIQSKTGVGDYYYGGSPNCAAGSNAGSHAVCKAGSNTYAYDLNGNLTAGGGRVIGWTAWNMPGGIIQDGQFTTWFYGPEHERYKMVAPGRTTWYQNPSVHQGNHLEVTRYANGTTEYRATVYGGGQPIGEIINFGDGSPDRVRYFHSDAQGSITAVTDANGVVLTRYRYDPWGKQTVVSGSNTGIDATRQGHTGHEMLDGGLTHMNGRLYDPLISRFVSADPIVQAPYNLQSLNRYSYVLNNPLYYTDPTGYSWWTKFRDKWLKPIAAIAVAWYVGPLVYNAMLPSAVGAAGATGMSMQASLWAGSAMAGATSGAVVGGISGGIFNGPQGIAQGVKYGAIGGAITGPVAAMYGGINGQGGSPWNLERVGVQSLAGGISSAAQGGSFAEGFKGSAISSGARYIYNSIVRYDIDPRAGGDAVDKSYDPLAMPIKGANNFGTAGALNPESFWGEGGTLSRAANQIFSMNAIAGMHDVYQVRLEQWGGVWARNILNAPGMLPAAGITWMGMRDSPYLTYDTIQRIEEGRAR